MGEEYGPKRHYRPWTNDDKVVLKQLVQEGYKVKAIAGLLERTPKTVQAYKSKMFPQREHSPHQRQKGRKNKILLPPPVEAPVKPKKKVYKKRSKVIQQTIGKNQPMNNFNNFVLALIDTIYEQYDITITLTKSNQSMKTTATKKAAVKKTAVKKSAKKAAPKKAAKKSAPKKAAKKSATKKSSK